MPGLVANATASTTRTVANDGWWPDIDLAELRQTTRLDGTVPEPRLCAMAVDAVLDVNTQLAAWQGIQRDAGIENSTDITGPGIGGKPAAVQHYMSAVRSLVQAAAAEAYRDFDTTAAGDKKADALAPNIDAFRRNAAWAIRAIQGKSHACVELI